MSRKIVLAALAVVAVLCLVGCTAQNFLGGTKWAGEIAGIEYSVSFGKDNTYEWKRTDYGLVYSKGNWQADENQLTLTETSTSATRRYDVKLKGATMEWYQQGTNNLFITWKRK